MYIFSDLIYRKSCIDFGEYCTTSRFYIDQPYLYSSLLTKPFRNYLLRLPSTLAETRHQHCLPNRERVESSLDPRIFRIFAIQNWLQRVDIVPRLTLQGLTFLRSTFGGSTFRVDFEGSTLYWEVDIEPRSTLQGLTFRRSTFGGSAFRVDFEGSIFYREVDIDPQSTLQWSTFLRSAFRRLTFFGSTIQGMQS